MAKKKSTTIAGGAWTQLRVNGEPIGLTQGASYSEDFGVQPLEVLNHLGPIEYESLGYSCEITVRWLISKDKADFNKVVPKREEIQKNGFIPENVIEFINTATNTVHNAFRKAVVSRVGETIESNQFISGDMTFMAVERIV